MPNTSQQRISIKAPPKTKADEILEESFYKELAGQAERLDKFAQELIKLQLAIPALYAAILKLLEIAQTTTSQNTPTLLTLMIIFTPWLVALGLSFLAIFPVQHYDVKPNPIIEPITKKPPAKLAINAYLHFSAQRKFRLLAASSFLTFFGIAFAIFSSF